MIFMKCGFRFKITAAIAAVAFFCVIAALFFNYSDSKRMLEDNYIQSLDEKMNIQVRRFDDIMREMYLAACQMTHSAELRQQIKAYLEEEHTSIDSMELSRKLDDLLALWQLNHTVYLYLPKYRQVLSSAEYAAVRNLVAEETLPWMEPSDNPFIPLYFTNQMARSSQCVYAYSHAIYDDSGELLGILCITMDERQVYYALLDSMNSKDHETYRLLSPDGRICSTQDVTEIGHQTQGLSQAHTNRMNAEVVNGKNLYISVEAPFTRYRLQCQSELNRLTDALRTRILFLIMASILVTIFLVFIAQEMSVRISRPINELVQAMDQVSVGDFRMHTWNGTGDEFDALREHFNNMVSQIDALMEQIVRERTQKKQAELNALQYQIRPHFMYNTLNSIRMAAVVQRNHKLAELLASFIALLEASIQRNGAFIPLREEIKLVKDYLSLQSFRYFDCFETTYDIQPEAYDCFVPCLLMQPMAENAVFHGVDTKRNDNLIQFAAWIETNETGSNSGNNQKDNSGNNLGNNPGKQLLISIQDNGKGLQPEAKPKPEEEAKTDQRRFTGIGLSNVEQRLRLYYGEKADFTIESRPGAGTTVLFRLPVSHDPDEYSL